MKLLILGGSGMLGHKLVQVLGNSFEVFSTIRGRYAEIEKYGMFEKAGIIENVDVEDLANVSNIVERIKPEVLINAIGIVKQLPSSKDVIKTISINALLPHQLAEIAENNGSKLISISTDCVFDGARGRYTEDDFPNATDLYGKTKHLGEVDYGNHLTLRTSIIGRELTTSHSLIEWFLSNRGKNVKGFVNAIYSGFPTVVLADIIGELILKFPDLNGLFHVSSEPIDKFELLTLIKRYFRLDIEISPDTEFKIDRSLDSTKFRKATGFSPQNWDEMIKRMAEDASQCPHWR